MKIKICGLKREQDIVCANQLKPDYIGFIFYEKSKRAVTKEHAKALKQSLDKGIKAVGVFVNESPNVIQEIVQSGIIDLVQLHGDETEEYIKNLRKILSMETQIIKAFSVSSAEDIEKAKNSSADYVLLDNSKGGTGKAFCWELLKNNMPKNAFLAGGITTENIYQAAKLYPYCLDVSSGAETDGVKDYDKMKSLITAARCSPPL